MQDQTIVTPRIELERPSARPSIVSRLAWMSVLVGVVAAGAYAWERGYIPAWLKSDEGMTLDLVEVDRGDIEQYVVEFGTIESATDAVVRCQVEALTGLVGGTNANGTTKGAGGTGASGSGSTSTQSTTTPAAPVATTKSSSSATAKSSTSSGSSASGSSSSSSSASGSSTASSSDSSAGGSSSGSTASKKPTIRSFTYTVAKYTPLKRTTTNASATSKNGNSQGGSGGGRGGRGGGGGGGGGGMEEKPGSTRIITILPEGTHVKEGDVVCTLDSASFRDELKAQQIRWLQAKSFVEQAASMLAVNEITLREYKEGILPQDIQQVRQYVQTCEIERDRSQRNLEWSRGINEKGLRTSSQLRADELSLQQTQFVLSEAKGMLDRLEKYTGPKILKSLEAKLASIRADKLAQDSSFALEDERLRRLEKNVAACTLTAPSDGVVVYVNQTNGWGRVESAIQEGVTVRQDQPIFQLPDPKRMRIKARINETKVALLRSGQECAIRIDAYPERPLHGKVTDVTAISSPVNGPFSDVRVYFALINIEDAFEDLRPGLSAEVTFLHDRRSQVDRVPIGAVRQVEGQSFVAVYERTSEKDAKPSYHWQKVDLGLSDSDYVEVVSGVRQGDRIVANPLPLEAPPTSPQPSQIAANVP